MRTLLISAVLMGTLATGTAIEPAQAKGCIKGALVGGLAGHAAGHGVLGAAGGCVAGPRGSKTGGTPPGAASTSTKSRDDADLRPGHVSPAVGQS
jgi:hypothetical protein